MCALVNKWSGREDLNVGVSNTNQGQRHPCDTNLGISDTNP